jgi:GNAT superfamily N-acetyltransferase
LANRPHSQRFFFDLGAPVLHEVSPFACIHDGVALFGGSATVPELRRRGLQAALVHKRMHYAFDHGCDLAMMVAQPGSDSQRNAERKGFRIAYTRTKWRLCS